MRLLYLRTIKPLTLSITQEDRTLSDVSGYSKPKRMLTVPWKDFEQGPLRKYFLKHLASTSKTSLPQLLGTNHSDYCLRYASETNGDCNSSTSNLPSFTVNWKKKFTCDRYQGSVTEIKYGNLTDAYMDLSSLRTNGMLSSLNSWPPKILPPHIKTPACLSTTSSNATYRFTWTTLEYIRPIPPTWPLSSKTWKRHLRSRTSGKPHFYSAYILHLHQTVLLLPRNNTWVLSSLDLEWKTRTWYPSPYQKALHLRKGLRDNQKSKLPHTNPW